MGFKYKKSFSKTAKREFAQKMDEINIFCSKHNISQSMSSDSYYFEINNIQYRVSNHSVESSDQRAYNHFGEKVRNEYHGGRRNEVVYIHASKTRLIEIYNNLKAGKTLDGRGYPI